MCKIEGLIFLRLNSSKLESVFVKLRNQREETLNMICFFTDFGNDVVINLLVQT